VKGRKGTEEGEKREERGMREGGGAGEREERDRRGREEGGNRNEGGRK
jgi:hypothetical protein